MQKTEDLKGQSRLFVLPLPFARLPFKLQTMTSVAVAKVTINGDPLLTVTLHGHGHGILQPLIHAQPAETQMGF